MPNFFVTAAREAKQAIVTMAPIARESQKPNLAISKGNRNSNDVTLVLRTRDEYGELKKMLLSDPSRQTANIRAANRALAASFRQG